MELMLTVSSRALRAGEGTSVATPFPAPKPPKTIVLKSFGINGLTQNRRSPKPLQLSLLISEAYPQKRAVFQRKDSSTCCCSLKSRGFAPRKSLPKPAKAIEVKSIAIIDLDHKWPPPNPLELSLLISRDYTSKTALFQQKDGYARLLAYRADHGSGSAEISADLWSSVTSVSRVMASNVREARTLGPRREPEISYPLGSEGFTGETSWPASGSERNDRKGVWQRCPGILLSRVSCRGYREG